MLSIKARLVLLVFVSGLDAEAQTRRALLVGIDHYLRPDAAHPAALSEKTRQRLAQIQGRPSRQNISDLEGAVNDARQLQDLLVKKYKFDPANIIFLIDEEATADRILSSLQSHLVDAAKPGDASFFYYAGHGSRIKNTLTENRTGMDSTLVPADTLLGVPDIRSKELIRIYSQARKKGVELTVIQDSCFSGALTRGPRPAGKTRVQDPDSQVSVAEKLEGPLPEEQGVLFFSAAQDYQPAQEIQDDQLGKHGAFTWALLQALAVAGENERVDRIFQRTRALMQSKVDDQEPVVLQAGGRNGRGLFGQPADAFGAATAAVGFVKKDQGQVELNSGVTMGLAPGSELKRITPPDPPLRIRITEVNGPSSANAELLDPTQIASVAPGHLFQLDKLVVPDKEFLRLYVGDALPLPQLREAGLAVSALRGRPEFEFVDDVTRVTPSHVVLWDGEQKRWKLVENRASGTTFLTQTTLSAPAIVQALAAQKPKAKLGVVLPPAAEMIAGLNAASTGNIAVFTASVENADYLLLGRVNASGGLEYAWARSSVTEEDLKKQGEAARRAKQPPVIAGWPLRSDWLSVSGPAIATDLSRKAVDLAKVAGWLKLQTPVPDNSFPYHLALRQKGSGQLSDGDLTGTRTYDLLLRLDPAAAKQSVPHRRVYVFLIDSFGKGTLLFGRSTLDNEFPPKDAVTAPVEIDLKTAVVIESPYGVDNYFLLTSAQPIDNPETVFNFQGVRTRGAGSSSGLAKLLQNRASGTRGALSGVPTDWSIERIAFRSLEP